MTSLVITSYRPYKPIGGAPLRNWQNINVLAAHGPVDVMTVDCEDPAEPIDVIREWAPFSLRDRSRSERLKTSWSAVRPGVHPGIDSYYSGDAAAWVRQQARQGRYDVAVLETIAVASYLDVAKESARRVVFDAHNVEATLQPTLADEAPPTTLRRIKNHVLRDRMMATERRVVQRADLVWACSDSDAKEIQRLYGRTTGLTVVPNGVDVPSYRPQHPMPADWSHLPVTMIYPGLFTYLPNEDAAQRLIRDVLPLVRARGRAARVVLVGRDPSPALVALARASDGVELTGSVESVVPYLRQPCVVTLPIALGGGTRLKILEAFAADAPVVSTAKGAEGLDAIDGEHLLLRDEPAGLAAAVLECWDNPALRRALCARALGLVERRYSWSAVSGRIAESLGLAGGEPPQFDAGRTMTARAWTLHSIF